MLISLSVEKEEPLWDHSPQFLIGDARHHWEDSMKTNEVDDDIALALIPRKLFETSDDDDSVFEDGKESNSGLQILSKKNKASSTNNNFLDELSLDDDKDTSFEESENRNQKTGKRETVRKMMEMMKLMTHVVMKKLKLL